MGPEALIEQDMSERFRYACAMDGMGARCNHHADEDCTNVPFVCYRSGFHASHVAPPSVKT
jgi:hypothetical protein